MTRIEYLSDRCIKGLASEEELLELQQMIADPQYSEKAAELLRKGFLQVPEPQDMSAESSRQIRTAILDAHRELKPNAGFVSFIRRSRWMAAASVLLLVTLAVFFIFSPDSGLSNQNNLTNTLIHDVKPGRDGAILTLADGSQLVLDSLGNGIISTG